MSPHPRICRGGFRAAIVLLFGLCLPLFSGVAGAMIVVGTGLDSVYVTFESPNIGIRNYQVNFTYNPSATGYATFDSYDALRIIDAADSLISFNLINGTSSEAAHNYYLSAITFNGIAEANAPFPDPGPFWGQLAAGGVAGYPNPEPIPSDSWTTGGGISAPWRVMAPGSNEAFVFAEDPIPSFAPIPEPGVTWLALAGLGVLFRRRR